MRRREFITLIGGAVATRPVPSVLQQGARRGDRMSNYTVAGLWFNKAGRSTLAICRRF